MQDVRLEGADAVKAAGLASCLKASLMARSSICIERLNERREESFSDLLDFLAWEFYIYVADAIIGSLLDRAGSYRKDLTPHSLMAGSSLLDPLKKDAKRLLREFLRRARQYVANMRLRNALAAVRKPVEASFDNGVLDCVPGSETGAVLSMVNPTGEHLAIRPMLALPREGISVVEPEASYKDGMHILPAVDIPPGGRRDIRLTFFVPVGEDPGDSRGWVVLMPAERDVLPELGGAGLARDQRTGALDN